jgi:hypothetical protein
MFFFLPGTENMKRMLTSGIQRRLICGISVYILEEIVAYIFRLLEEAKQEIGVKQ